jgi:hypothetical protein
VIVNFSYYINEKSDDAEWDGNAETLTLKQLVATLTHLAGASRPAKNFSSITQDIRFCA